MSEDPQGAPRAEAWRTMETRVTDLVIRLGFLALFIYGALVLIAPFLPVVVWSVIVTVALFPIHAVLRRWLGGRGRLSAVLITLAALALIVGPISVLAASLAETVQHLAGGLLAGTVKMPPPPDSVAQWPLVGERLHAAWQLASTNLEGAVRAYGPTFAPTGRALVGQLATLGGGVAVFLIAVIISGFLFEPGVRLAGEARRFGSRLLAPRGAEFVDLAGATIRSVSQGVIGVAALQALLFGVVLVAFDVPGAGLFAFIGLVLCIVQIGLLPLSILIVAWAFHALPTAAAGGLTVLLVLVGLLDNVLKPLVIARGLKTPMLVIIVGVIGGALSAGLIGLFIGPVVLAVFYELFVAWMRYEETGAAPQ